MTAEMIKAAIDEGRTVCNVGTWLPCARRWIRSAERRGLVERVWSGYPDGRPAFVGVSK